MLRNINSVNSRTNFLQKAIDDPIKFSEYLDMIRLGLLRCKNNTQMIKYISKRCCFYPSAPCGMT